MHGFWPHDIISSCHVRISCMKQLQCLYVICPSRLLHFSLCLTDDTCQMTRMNGERKDRRNERIAPDYTYMLESLVTYHTSCLIQHTHVGSASVTLNALILSMCFCLFSVFLSLPQAQCLSVYSWCLLHS